MVNFFIIWQAPRAGKMNQIARCDWLPERARWSHLARSGRPAVSRKKNFTESHIINPLLTKFVYWPRSFFASLWISTSSRSINTQKKNSANIQPSWPHTWSITHTSWRKLGRSSAWPSKMNLGFIPVEHYVHVTLNKIRSIFCHKNCYYPYKTIFPITRQRKVEIKSKIKRILIPLHSPALGRQV